MSNERLSEHYKRVTGFSSLSPRRERYIWTDLFIREGLDFQSHPTESQILEELSTVTFRNGYLDSVESYMLHANELDWIENSRRQLFWIRNKLIKQYKLRGPLEISPHSSHRPDILYPEEVHSGLSNKDTIILIFDLMDDNLEGKTRLVRRLKEGWKAHSVPVKSISWFKEQADLKIDLFNKQLKKVRRKRIPIETTSSIEDVEITYDSFMHYYSELDFNEIIRKTKLAFAKDKHNKKNKKARKKPYNMTLPISLMDKVKERADSKGITLSQEVISILNAEMDKK